MHITNTNLYLIEKLPAIRFSINFTKRHFSLGGVHKLGWHIFGFFDHLLTSLLMLTLFYIIKVDKRSTLLGLPTHLFLSTWFVNAPLYSKSPSQTTNSEKKCRESYGLKWASHLKVRKRLRDQLHHNFRLITYFYYTSNYYSESNMYLISIWFSGMEFTTSWTKVGYFVV